MHIFDYCCENIVVQLIDYFDSIGRTAKKENKWNDSEILLTTRIFLQYKPFCDFYPIQIHADVRGKTIYWPLFCYLFIGISGLLCWQEKCNEFGVRFDSWKLQYSKLLEMSMYALIWQTLQQTLLLVSNNLWARYQANKNQKAEYSSVRNRE